MLPTLASSVPGSTSLRNEIKKQMRYPDFAKDEQRNGLVLVKYEVHSNGRIEVIHMNASDPLWAAYVQQKLESLSVEDQQQVGLHYAKFTFRYHKDQYSGTHPVLVWSYASFYRYSHREAQHPGSFSE